MIKLVREEMRGKEAEGYHHGCDRESIISQLLRTFGSTAGAFCVRGWAKGPVIRCFCSGV